MSYSLPCLVPDIVLTAIFVADRSTPLKSQNNLTTDTFVNPFSILHTALTHIMRAHKNEVLSIDLAAYRVCLRYRSTNVD
jgi:hypothetical protein